MQPLVILVDEHDQPRGTESKQLAHRRPMLHRAYSILLFRSNGELILQRRADNKYHSAGLWSNTCCSHPIPGIDLSTAATTRLQQEMGITAEIEEIGTLHYELELPCGLFEHEFNHVFCGISDQQPTPDPEEARDWKTLPLADVSAAVAADSTRFTAWFPLVLQHLEKPLRQYVQKFTTKQP